MSRWFASIGFAFALSLATRAAWSQDAGERQGSMQGMPMSDGGMIADGGMMGGMMADGGMTAGGGRMGGMSCSQMMGGADVTVQNTKDGATIQMRAKSMAQMMKNCMSGEQR
jgi:hypothetical protein